MMKIIYFLIILIIPFSTMSGQKESVTVQDPMAEPFLDKLADTFSSENTYNIEFKYEIESKVDNYKTEDYGSVIVQGKKYKLKTDDAEVYYNGTTMWTYNLENKEVYVSTPEPDNLDQMILVPFVLLMHYKDYFKYRYIGEKKINSKIINEIDLYPINLDGSFSIFKIKTEKSTGRIYSFVVQQKNGFYYNVFINEMIPSVKVTSDTFEWRKELHPDVLIIEL